MVSGGIKLMGAIALLIASVSSPMSGAQAAGEATSGYVAVGGTTLVPYGWVDFCARYKGECDAPALPALDVNASAAAMKRLKQINAWVNSNVKPMSDKDHWGVVDRWDYPTDGYGDCEDYVLLKRRLLIDEGFPRQGLLVTVVRDEKGEGHAVLTVKTNKGEYVLDNLDDEVRAWTKTRYRFVKRQSQTDPNVWVDLGDPTSAPLVVSR
jgi:predicted transglutaminase-like cysteine proteinase